MERAEILAEVSAKIRQRLLDREPDLVWDAFLQGICPAMKCSAGSYFAVDEAARKLTLAHVYGPHSPLIKNMVMSYEGIAGWVAETRRAVIVNDTAAEPRFFKDVDAATGFKTSSILCVPIVHTGRLLGVVELINPAAGKFTEADLETVTYICAGVVRITTVKS